MSDIYCVVCGEPWDAYGVKHGDMLPWEAKLFQAGAGCPSCEGESNGFEPTKLAHTENGDEDPMLRIAARERYENDMAPQWVRPEDPVLWTCDGCGVQAIRNVDDGALEYDLPRGAKARSWYSHNYPDDEPAHTFSDGSKVCEFCLDHCHNCGAEVSSTLDTGDPYAPGWCATLEPYGYQDVFCIACVESTCGDCNSLPEDCECHSDDDSDDDDDCEDSDDSEG